MIRMRNRTFVIGCNETEYIVMSQHDSLIDFSFPKPGAFLSRTEYLDGDVLSSPATPPDFTESSLANGFDQLNLSCYTALHQKW